MNVIEILKFSARSDGKPESTFPDRALAKAFPLVQAVTQLSYFVKGSRLHELEQWQLGRNV